MGYEIPLHAGEMGRFGLGAISFGVGSPKLARGPEAPASYLEWALKDKRPDLSNVGIHLPAAEDGLYRFEPPEIVSACKAIT